MSVLDNYRGKSFSTRFSEEQLEYFLKYAQETGAKNISETFDNMMQELEHNRPLNHVEIKHVPFKPRRVLDQSEKEIFQPFLQAKEDSTEEINVTVEPEPEPEPEQEPEDDDKDVLEI